MPDFLKDGKGRGNLAEVNSENQLITRSIIADEGKHAATFHSKYYTNSFSAQATGVGDRIGYIKNTSPQNMIIDFYSVYSSAETQIHLHMGETGTPAGGTDSVSANVVAGSGSVADGTFQDGVDITGLSGGSNIEVSVTPADETKYYDKLPLVIPPNQTASFWAYQNTATVYIGVAFYYHDVEG